MTDSICLLANLDKQAYQRVEYDHSLNPSLFPQSTHNFYQQHHKYTTETNILLFCEKFINNNDNLKPK